MSYSLLTDDRFKSLPAVLTSAQYGEFFGVKPQTVHRWRKRGKIQAIADTGNRLYGKDQVARRINQLTPSEAFV